MDNFELTRRLNRLLYDYYQIRMQNSGRKTARMAKSLAEIHIIKNSHCDPLRDEIREFGRQSHERGGLPDMLELYYAIGRFTDGPMLQDRLNKLWAGIGDWWD